MTRTILGLLAGAALAFAQSSTPTSSSSYHFTTPLSAQTIKEVVTTLNAAAAVPNVDMNAASQTVTFSGPAQYVDFAAWLLPQIDKPAGTSGHNEYRLPSGDIGVVRFLPGFQTPQQMQEMLTILRTVADVQKIFAINENRVMVLRSPDWQVAFSNWIMDQMDQASQGPAPREFTVGGPDYRGMGHGARINFLASLNAPIQMQELLTILRTVDEVQKVFSFSSQHAMVFRASDDQLSRAEWIIQQLDQPAAQPTGSRTFTGSSGDDVTRMFSIANGNAEFLHSAVASMRTDIGIREIFSMTRPATIFARGTPDQIAAAAAWLAQKNAVLQ